MLCKICGNDVSENEKFCRGCGSSIEDAIGTIQNDSVVADEPIISDEILGETSSVTVLETVYEDKPLEEITDTSKPLRKNPHGFISFICFLFMLIVFFLESILGVLITLKFTTSESAVKNAIKEFDITSLEISVDGEQKTFAETIIDEVSNDEVSEEDINRVIEEFQGDEYFSSVITDITDYALNGGEAPKLDADELAGVIEDNKALIEDVTGEKIGDKELDNFKKSAETFVEDFNKNIEDLDVAKDINKITEKFSINLAVYGVAGIILALLIILVLCYKFNGSGVYRVFKSFNTPTFTVGIIYVIIGAVLPKVLEGNVTGSGADLIMRLVNSFAKFPLYTGIVLMVIWVVSLILSIVLKVVYNKNTRIG